MGAENESYPRLGLSAANGGRSWAVWIILASVAFGSLIAVESTVADSCYSEVLDRPLYWVTSGAASPSGNTLLVPDQHWWEVMAIGQDGHVVTRLAESLTVRDSLDTSPLVQPSKIHAIDGGYLLEDEKYPYGRGNDIIYRLDNDFNVVDKGSILIKGRGVAENLKLNTIFDWAPIGPGGEQVLAMGNFSGPGQAITALVRLHADGSSELYEDTIIKDQSSPAIELYIKNINYITHLARSAYVLFLEQDARLGEVTPGMPGIRTLGLPADFKKTPALYRDISLEGEAFRQTTDQYKVIEATRMPMGIYGWKNHLYLLAKEALTSRVETTWWLIQLDPQDGSELGRARLPTKATHLTVIPGENWTLIEKGPVQGVGRRSAPYMHTTSMVVFPGTWVEDPDRGPLSRSARPKTCELRGN